MRTVLILEDKPERKAAFERVAPSLGLRVKIWDDADRMRRECEKFLPDAALISLEQDLDINDRSTGLDVAKFLAEKSPVCPVIVHTGNTDRSFSIFNELRFAAWNVDRVAPICEGWIDKYWKPKARQLMTA